MIDNQTKSVLLSILISLVVFTPILQFTINITKPTQEQIDFCNRPNVICDSYLPVVFISEFVGCLCLYYVLTQRFDKYFKSQSLSNVREK